MAQAEVLQRARLGDATAIAILINTSLASRGITATVERIGDRLLIAYTATQVLKAESMLRFTQTGLQNLALSTFQSVQISGMKAGCETPLWQVELRLQGETSRLYPRLGVAAQPGFESGSTQHPLVPSQVSPTETVKRLAASAKHLNLSQPKYFFSVSFFILMGFFLGAIAAFFKGSPPLRFSTLALLHPPVEEAQIAATQPPAAAQTDDPLQKQQQAIAAYLLRMTDAQQEFYVEFGRLTRNLEELERFASVISQTQNYKVEFVRQNDQQATLQAIAKTDELKSYTSTVRVKFHKDIPKLIARVCATESPSQIPPAIPSSSLECPLQSQSIPLPHSN
ncbi:MAG TPA: hypothetical protein IGS53_01595 [Leptolyngbyaceae cyanobacterium M33_DOE_097]|uniref:Uncharacterized protein n=1 Tax=Oscillatoriales cyanobacterium SpSt-418 TaxID=2282169 RepID=A0A7C3KFB8_9CYAN|nr:hypothetical protein [Leptolyngbyaceae cyanobacterium M33_DOE_097]